MAAAVWTEVGNHHRMRGFPFASLNAFLHSIIPAPVWSRSFFTISAVIAVVAIVLSPYAKKAGP